VRFVTVNARKFFGFESCEINGRDVRLSSKPKTLVDCVDRPDLCGGIPELVRIVFAAAHEIDPQDLIDTVMAFKSKSVMQRLGFIADLVDRPLRDPVRQAIRSAIPASYSSYFGRAERRVGDIGYIAAWGLHVNVPKTGLITEGLSLSDAF